MSTMVQLVSFLVWSHHCHVFNRRRNVHTTLDQIPFTEILDICERFPGTEIHMCPLPWRKTVVMPVRWKNEDLELWWTKYGSSQLLCFRRACKHCCFMQFKLLASCLSLCLSLLFALMPQLRWLPNNVSFSYPLILRLLLFSQCI